MTHPREFAVPSPFRQRVRAGDLLALLLLLHTATRRSCPVPHEGCGKIAGSKIAILLQEIHKYYWCQEIPLAGSGAEEAEAEEAEDESETESESGSSRLGYHLQSIIPYILSAIFVVVVVVARIFSLMHIIRSVTHLLWVNQGIWFSKGASKDPTLWWVGWDTGAGRGGMFEIRGVFFFSSLFWFSEPLAVCVFWSNMIIPRLCWVGRKRSLSTAQMQQQQ